MNKSFQIEIPSQVEEISAAVDKTLSFCTSLGFTDDVLFNIDIPLREALANAIEHGNGLGSEKAVELCAEETHDGVRITVRDHGSGFDPEKVANPTEPENLLATSGRGLLFMQSLLDSVEWAKHPNGGTVVRMTKNRG